LNNKTSGRPWPQNNTVKLGQAVTNYLQTTVEPKQSVSAPLLEAWALLLPPELAQHCRPDKIKGSVLTVSVDGSAYMHELRLCSAEILNQLSSLCPRARLKKIKPVLK